MNTCCNRRLTQPTIATTRPRQSHTCMSHHTIQHIHIQNVQYNTYTMYNTTHTPTPGVQHDTYTHIWCTTQHIHPHPVYNITHTPAPGVQHNTYTHTQCTTKHIYVHTIQYHKYTCRDRMIAL